MRTIPNCSGIFLSLIKPLGTVNQNKAFFLLHTSVADTFEFKEILCFHSLNEREGGQVRSTHYSNRLHDFSVTIPRCYKDVYVNSFFLRTARLWNSLPIECFPLTNDLSGKSRINRHLLTVGSS